MKCNACNGQKYVVVTRSDKMLAIERCDDCSWAKLKDEDAAILFIQNGGKCKTTYPCYITGNGGGVRI